VQDESQPQQNASNLEAGSAERQVKSKFEASFQAVQKATFGSMGCRPRARSVLHCHGVLALRDRPLTAAVPDESHLQDAAGHFESWECRTAVYAVQKATFGSMGCRPRARSVLHCHGVWALQEGPWPGAVQDESQLQENASNLEAGSAERQVKSRFESRFEASF